jgi:hypothetical protein
MGRRDGAQAVGNEDGVICWRGARELAHRLADFLLRERVEVDVARRMSSVGRRNSAAMPSAARRRNPRRPANYIVSRPSGRGPAGCCRRRSGRLEAPLIGGIGATRRFRGWCPQRAASQYEADLLAQRVEVELKWGCRYIRSYGGRGPPVILLSDFAEPEGRARRSNGFAQFRAELIRPGAGVRGWKCTSSKASARSGR